MEKKTQLQVKSTNVGINLTPKKSEEKTQWVTAKPNEKKQEFIRLIKPMKEEETDVKPEEKFKIVKLHWMRHAVSCANMLKIIGLAGLSGLLKDPSILLEGKIDPRSKYAADSRLSDFGINKASDLQNRLDNVDDLRNKLFGDDKIKLVLTSNLRRAIETAIYSFGGLKGVVIVPVPYVGEQSSVASKVQGIEVDESNKPSKLNDLKSAIAPLLSSMVGNMIDWTFLEASNKKYKKDPISEVDSDKFNTEILPEILKKYSVKNIVIVSHTNFISMRSKLSKIKNLEIISETIPYTIDNGIINLRSGTWNNNILNKDETIDFENKDYVINNVLNAENYKSCKFPSSIDKKVDNIKSKYQEYLKQNPIKTGGFLESF